MPNQYWRVELMHEIIDNYTEYLLRGEIELANEEKKKIDEFILEMSRDIMMANEKIISRDKRISHYQKQEMDNFKVLDSLRNENSDLISVVEYYARENTYKMAEYVSGDLLEHMRKTSPIAVDLGERAREILKEIKK